MPIRFFGLLLLFISLTFSAIAQQYKDTELESPLYSGKRPNQSLESFNESINYALASDNGKHLETRDYSDTDLPLLVDWPLENISSYIRNYGFPIPEGEEQNGSLHNFEFSDEDFSGIQTVRVAFTETFSVSDTSNEKKTETLAVGYYLHRNEKTFANIIFHSAYIYKPSRTAYYQEIKEKFKRSRNMIFKEKKTRFENKNLKFYHKKRDDGYIESYGFFLTQKKTIQEAKAVLLFQGLYPESDKTKIAKHVKHLFKSHLKAFKTRNKE